MLSRSSIPVKHILQIGGLLVLCIALWGPTTTSGAITYNRALYVLHFMNMSTDRSAVVNQSLYVSSNEDTQIRVEVPTVGVSEYATLDASNGPQRTYSRHFNQDFGQPRGESVSQSAILVVSDGTPIWIQVNEKEQGTTAAYLALPITQHATEFFIPSYHNTPNPTFHTGFAVTGLDDGTCMEVYKVNGDAYERKSFIHLDALEVYTNTDSSPDFDYTGYYINSTKPIAVYGGHECAYVPADKGHCDAILEQIPPVIEWGTEFIIAPIDGRGGVAGYEFRVIAQNQSTDITYIQTGEATPTTVTIDRGQDFYSNESIAGNDQLIATVYLTCSKKCLVVQYNKGKDADSSSTNPNDGKKTDPFMMIVPPLDHYDNDMRFTTMKHYDIGNAIDSFNYISIVARYSERAGMRLDGSSITGWTMVTGKPEYAYHTQVLNPGFHTLRHTDNSEEFMAWVYGHGSGDYTGYGYMAGYKFNDLPIADVDGRYDVTPPTTVAPTTTEKPWILGNWTDTYNQSELPKFSTFYWAEFHTTSRDNGQTIGQQVCSNGYKSFFVNERLPRMAVHLTASLVSMCGSAAQGSVVELSTYDSWFYTEYTQGNLSFAQTMIGSPAMTFREVVICANKLRDYTEDSRNWPISAEGETVVNNRTFLMKTKTYMKSTDCDVVEMGRFTTNTYEFLKASRQSWLCNGATTQTFGDSIFDSALSTSYSYILLTSALLFYVILAQLQK